MIHINDNIIVGKWEDVSHVVDNDIEGVLCVAQDMNIGSKWVKGVEYAQVGLVDGPGNTIAGYSSAVLTLATLLARHKKVMVCCHDGASRSIAVAVMYLILKTGKVSTHPTFFNYWKTWDKMICEIYEKPGPTFLKVHLAHREACDRMPFGILEELVWAK